jgi:hypothetical protein
MNWDKLGQSLTQRKKRKEVVHINFLNGKNLKKKEKKYSNSSFNFKSIGTFQVPLKKKKKKKTIRLDYKLIYNLFVII